MELTVSRKDNAHIIALHGRWDTFTAGKTEEIFAEFLHDNALRFVVLDLSRVDYVSSFGLRALLNLGKALEPLDGGVHLTGLQPAVRKVFEGSGFFSLFPDFPDVGTALASFASNKA